MSEQATKVLDHCADLLSREKNFTGKVTYNFHQGSVSDKVTIERVERMKQDEPVTRPA